VLAAPVLYGYFVVDATFRASGDTRTPFLILLASVALALVLDPLLIMGLGGLPRLGIAGAAVATVLTRSLAFAVGLTLLVRRGMLRVGPPRPAVMLTVARVGLPTAATGVLFSVVYVVIGRTASVLGTPALAALGLGFRVESWLYMIGVGFGAAAAAVVGQNLGAGRVDRAERAGWTMLAAASAPAVVAAALSWAVPDLLAGAFTRDAAVVAEAARYLRIVAVSQLVVCAEVVLEGALGGTGATLAPMAASVGITALRIPLAAWAGRAPRPRRGVVGHLAHGDRARPRDDGALAVGPLAAQRGLTPDTMRPIVTLLTDFGTADGYVAELKGVLVSQAPGVTLVDATHDVPAHDVESGRLALARYWRRFPPGTVHLAVVDPGVGGGRAALAVESDGRFLVGPDNGVLSPALLAAGARAVALPGAAARRADVSRPRRVRAGGGAPGDGRAARLAGRARGGADRAAHPRGAPPPGRRDRGVRDRDRPLRQRGHQPAVVRRRRDRGRRPAGAGAARLRGRGAGGRARARGLQRAAGDRGARGERRGAARADARGAGGAAAGPPEAEGEVRYGEVRYGEVR
jgi:hypothetical protein